TRVTKEISRCRTRSTPAACAKPPRRARANGQSGRAQEERAGRGLLRGERANVSAELGVFALEQHGQQRAEVFAPAPLAHVVLPRQPAPLVPPGHLRLVQNQIRALEQRDEDVEDDQHALALLVVELGRLLGAEQTQVGMAECHPEEVLIVVGEELIDLFVLVVALFLLLVNEHENGERQADRRDDVAQEFPRADVHGRASSPAGKEKGALSSSAPRSFAQLRSYSGS